MVFRSFKMLLFIIACLGGYVGASFEENTTEFFNTTANITVIGNNSVELERIVQPSQAFEQAPSNFSVQSRKEDTKFKDFRPSPQLETYYEYNKFPVVPALPEAKRFSSPIVGENPSRPWIGKILSERTTETAVPWVSKVRFPTQQPNGLVTSKDIPYPFVTNHGGPSTENLIKYGPPNLDYPMQKVPDIPYHHPIVINHEGPSSENLVKYGPPNFDFPVQKIPDTITPALFGFPNNGGDPNRYGGLQYGSIDKFERGRPVLEKTNFGLEERPSGDVSGFTWKKIVKFLTAAIPIGILISALTPSVINVSTVNATQKNRARSRENESRSNRQLISSLNVVEDLRSRGCEERILCELLISAGSSGNAKQNAENLLDVFMQQEKNAKKKSDQLKRMMESVRANNCDQFFCRLESENKREFN